LAVLSGFVALAFAIEHIVAGPALDIVYKEK